MTVLVDADLKHREVGEGMKCIWCHSYMPRQGFRCWGFINSDVDVCLEHGYSFYKARKPHTKHLTRLLI